MQRPQPNLTPQSLIPKHRSLRRSLVLFFGYLSFQWFIQLIALTFITFLTLHSSQSIPKIGDFMDANRIPVASIGAILFLGLLHILEPLSKTQTREIFSFSSLKSIYLYHALQGFVLGVVLVLGGLLAGHLTWLGIYVRFDEILLSALSAIFFTIGFFVMITLEEFLLRKCLEPQFRRIGGAFSILAASCVIFVFLKVFYFTLTIKEMINFILLNVVAFEICRSERNHLASATFITAFLFTMHTLFGLSFLGQDLPNLFLVRSVETGTNLELLNQSLGASLSGGIRGPENGLLFTLLLTVYLMLPWMRSQLKLKTSSEQQAPEHQVVHNEETP